jgi:hypothetical protein
VLHQTAAPIMPALAPAFFFHYARDNFSTSGACISAR